MSKKRPSKKVAVKTSASQSRLSIAYGKIESLENLVSDKESMIDNLMARAAELESATLAKDDVIQNLNDEAIKQKGHIDSLNKAIAQRDEHVTHLETRTNQFLDLLASNKNRQGFDEIASQYDQMSDLISKNHADILSCLDNGQQQSRDRHDSQISSFSTLYDSQESNLSTLRVSQENSFSNLYDSQTSNFSILKENSLQLSNAVDKTTVKLDNLGRLLAKDESNKVTVLSDMVTKLTNDLAHRDQWGANIQARLHELDQELSLIKSSLSWRIVSFFRFVPSAPRSALRALRAIVKYPYKMLVKLGWRFAPKLFHKIYHAPLVAKLARRHSTTVLPEKQESSISHTEHKANDFMTSMTPDQIQAIPISQFKWNIGTRIDGPEK